MEGPARCLGAHEVCARLRHHRCRPHRGASVRLIRAPFADCLLVCVLQVNNHVTVLRSQLALRILKLLFKPKQNVDNRTLLTVMFQLPEAVSIRALGSLVSFGVSCVQSAGGQGLSSWLFLSFHRASKSAWFALFAPSSQFQP